MYISQKNFYSSFPTLSYLILSSPTSTLPKSIQLWKEISRAIILISLFTIIKTLPACAQTQKPDFQYAVSPNQPYGAYNPEAPESLQDFEPMIGIKLCESVKRNQDGSWQDTTGMIREFKYIFYGKAVQDIM